MRNRGHENNTISLLECDHFEFLDKFIHGLTLFSLLINSEAVIGFIDNNVDVSIYHLNHWGKFQIILIQDDSKVLTILPGLFEK